MNRAHFSELLDSAEDCGLAGHAVVSMESEIHVEVPDEHGAGWIKHLTTSGYGFSNPVACYRVAGGTAAEARDAAGRRVLLRMMEGSAR